MRIISGYSKIPALCNKIHIFDVLIRLTGESENVILLMLNLLEIPGCI